MTALHAAITDPAARLRALTIERARLEAQHRGLVACNHAGRNCPRNDAHEAHKRLCEQIAEEMRERKEAA